MRLLDLEIRSFRGVRELSLDLGARVTAIRAANGRGKSSILQAIEWCLFGAQIEKKSSGIAARVDWELPFRGSADAGPRVRLRLASATSSTSTLSLEVTRTRDADGDRLTLVEETKQIAASAAAPDRGAAPEESAESAPRQAQLFETPLPANPGHESQTERREYYNDEAELRLEELQFPSWSEWRLAFCQHQEDPRRRIVESASRSAVLASLLGLDAWTELRARLDSLRSRKALQRLDAIDAGLSESAEAARTRDDDGGSSAEDALRERLRSRGLQLDADAATLRARAAQALGARGTELGAPFGLEAAPAINAGGGSAFATWARSFARDILRAAARSGRHGARLERRESLSAALATAQEAIDRAQSVQDSFARHGESSGTPEELRRRRSEAETALQGAQQTLRDVDARSALLREAQRYLRTRDVTSSECPLCSSTEAHDLARRIDRELEDSSAGERVELDKKIELAEAARAQADAQLRSLAKFEGDVERATAQRERSLAKLQLLLDTDTAHAPLDAARESLRALDAEIAAGQCQLEKLDEELEIFRRDFETWEDLGELVQAEARRDAATDGSALEDARTRYEKAVDRAATFAVDLEAIARFAREEQARASDARLSEVQRAFGEYARAILAGGHDAEERVYRFVQRGTAQNIKYDVVDETGKSALAIANQARLSAIAIALLFARAEARAREGRPSFVVLDDPAQSLDREHARGLVQAIERLARTCSVFVASPDGFLIDAVERLGRDSYRLHALERFDPRLGVRLSAAPTTSAQEEERPA